MKRVGGLWEHVVSFENLRRAALRAALGKRRVAAVARYLADLEPESFALQRALRAGRWRPGTPTRFSIHDPKERLITAAPFPDRVVHHALMDVLEPVLERRMVAESFACRRGKGTHAALDHARRRVRKHGWFLKLDVARCFDSMDHDVVLETLARVVKDRRVLALAEVLVRDGGRDGVGLPIGNLTSQWLANLTLDRLDHHVKERLRVRGYVRYMDDFVLFGEERNELRALHGEVAGFVERELELALKERATILAPTSQGLPFLGWRIYRGTTRLRPGNLRRIRARLRHRAWEHRHGRIDLETLVASQRSVAEHLQQGSTLALRRRLFEEGCEPQAARTGSTGVGRSTIPRGTRGRRIATTTTPATAGTTSASALAKATQRPDVRVTPPGADPTQRTRRPGSRPAPPD